MWLILILGAVFGASTAGAVPRYEPYCPFSACGAVSDDGKRAIFTFDEPLDHFYPGSGPDTIYERSGGRTRALIDFPEGGERPIRLVTVSVDARVAIVQTRSPLTRDDADGFGDDYFAIEDGVPRLLSWLPGVPDSRTSLALDMHYEWLSEDGRTVYFRARNGDNSWQCQDRWARTAETMVKLPIPCGGSRIIGLAADGSLFTSEDWSETAFRTRGDERDQLYDFDHSIGQTGCVRHSYFGDASADGETTLFDSDFRLVPEDQDAYSDIYRGNPDGSFDLLTLSEGPAVRECTDRREVRALALSPDGSRALFATQDRLSPEDLDGATDVYLHTPGKDPRLVTTGPSDQSPEIRNPTTTEMVGSTIPSWRVDVSDDLEAVAFDSRQRLVPEDRDSAIDVYLWRDGTTELISTGPTATGGNIDAKLYGVSNDGNRVAFSTMESLVPTDMDDRMDIYNRFAGSTSRVDEDEASISVARKPKRRTVLISAESIAPRMKVRGPVVINGRRAVVMLLCPRTEETGPCRGNATLRLSQGKASFSSRFRIKTGRVSRVRFRLDRTYSARSLRASVRGRASDGLGNTGRFARSLSVSIR
jgi:hypothetical protein